MEKEFLLIGGPRDGERVVLPPSIVQLGKLSVKEGSYRMYLLTSGRNYSRVFVWESIPEGDIIEIMIARYK